MGPRLVRISHAVNQREITGVVNRREKFQGWVESGEAVAQANRISIRKSGGIRVPDGPAHVEKLRWIEASTSGVCVVVGGVGGNANDRAARRISRVLHGNDGV